MNRHRKVVATRPFALIRAWFALLWLAQAAVVGVHGQSVTASLSGSVTDEQGSVISGAEVKLFNPATGFERTVRTNDEGLYVFTLLPPGNYTLTAQRDGFATASFKEVVLNVGDQKSLLVRLKIGNVGETVTVTASSDIKESAAVATIVDRQFVENLPLNGRTFQSLIALTPGVVITKASSGNPGQFSINGQRADANYLSVDGVSANVGHNGVNGVIGNSGGNIPALTATGGYNNLVSIDALQEFRIQTSTFAPEFGRTTGGQISLVTRSGTNDFRGTLFEYFRNDALDANDFFANSRGLKRAALRQNNFGGVLGGPLLLPRNIFGPLAYDGRNRTFFFFSYEGQRLRQPQVTITDVPSLAARQEAVAAIRPFLNTFPLPTGPVRANNARLAELAAVSRTPRRSIPPASASIRR